MSVTKLSAEGRKMKGIVFARIKKSEIAKRLNNENGHLAALLYLKDELRKQGINPDSGPYTMFPISCNGFYTYWQDAPPRPSPELLEAK